MNALELILSVLPSLTDKERLALQEHLKVSPCTKNGHKYREVATLPGGFFRKRCVILHCEKCGDLRKAPY